MKGSLQELSLLRATEEVKTLGEILDFCDANPRFEAIYSRSVVFWKKTLTRILGDVMVLQRGDLESGQQWYDFAKLLDEGVSYRYCLLEEEDGFHRTPTPFWRVDNPYDHGTGIERHPFDIPAVLPVRGTRGYFVFLDMYGYRNHQVTNFFLHGDDDEAFRLSLRYAADIYYNWHEPFELEEVRLLAPGDGETINFERATFLDLMEASGGNSIIQIAWEGEKHSIVHVKVKPLRF